MFRQGRPGCFDVGALHVPGRPGCLDLALLGRPYRKTIDPMGRTILVYLWADGDGNGEKCVIGFNEVGLVHSIEVTP